MTALYPDSMSAPGTQARLVRDPTEAQQAAVRRVIARKFAMGMPREDAYLLLDVLGLLPPEPAAAPPPVEPPAPPPPEPSKAPPAPAPSGCGLAGLAAAVTAQRLHLGLSQAGLARNGGLSASAIRDIEAATRTPRSFTRDRLDTGLGWAPGTTDRILGGDQ